MTDYADVDDLKLTLGITASTYDDLIGQSISAASAAIDEACDTRFDSDPEESVLLYTATGPNIVSILDTVSISGVEIDMVGVGNFVDWSTLNWTPEPENAAARGLPIRWLRPPRLWYWPKTPQGIRITGVRGWPAVPIQIVEATQLLAEQLWKRKQESAFGIMGLDQATAARVMREDPHLCALLRNFDRVAELVA